MPTHPLAGQPAPAASLVDLDRLLTAYLGVRADAEVPAQRVSFGTSGHRGSALRASFNETHILAIVQAICDYRRVQGIAGPLYLGRDTHALSAPACDSALEVLAANGVEVMLDSADGYTPTPLISHAILCWNRDPARARADGIVITPSHNPPEDGGIKYNPPHGGPADSAVTAWIEARANALIVSALAEVERIPLARARRAATTHRHPFVDTYVGDLATIVDLPRIRAAGIRIGVDPLGGAAIACWAPIAERYALDLEVVNTTVDPRFAFMTLDWDGKIRMDCSSAAAMAPLIALKDRYDLACGNDPDGDRHGIVTPSGGLMNPNHYLAVAIAHLFATRPGWRPDAAIGKTLVSSSLIDRVATSLGRTLVEVPVGFKWFVGGLLDGSLGFGGEESAGASFLRRDGSVWSTDKDGIIMNLLAAEILAVGSRDPALRYRELAAALGDPVYARIDAPANAAQKAALARLSPADVAATTLAGDPICAMHTTAPGNSAAIGGLKVVTEHGWFAARPSGTEDVYKLYAESFRGPAHLAQIQDEAQALVARALAVRT